MLIYLSEQKKKDVVIPESEYTLTPTRTSGPGGQHVNKVSTAIILRYDIHASSLAADVKERLLSLKDNRITEEGILILRAAEFKSQKKNKEEAVRRLYTLVAKALRPPKKRKATKPTKESVEKKKEKKSQRSELKDSRKKVKL